MHGSDISSPIMSRLFSSLRRGSSTTPTAAIVDEKDHGDDDDDDDIELGSASPSLSSSILVSPREDRFSPLLPTNTSLLPDHPTTPTPPAPSESSSSFALRIKFNNGKSTTDYKLSNIPTASSMTVGMLKARILSEYDRRVVMARTNSSSSSSTADNTDGGTTTTTTTTACDCNNSNHHRNNNEDGEERYLRLIIRGRMMAPDRNTLATFCIVNYDVIHAVLTIQPSTTINSRNSSGGISSSGRQQVVTRRGQQARMLHRINNNSNTDTSGGRGEIPLLWRRTGIDYNGIVVPPRDMTNNNNDEDDDDSTSSSEDDDDVDIDMDNIDIATSEVEGNNNGGSGRRRRLRERRGFDRLRATGMTREEVATIRAYFARSVNRYIDRRWIILTGSRRLRETLESQQQQQRGRTDSTNSLLDNTATTTTTAAAATDAAATDAAAATTEVGGVGEQSSAANNGGSGGTPTNTNTNIDTSNTNTNSNTNNNEGEEEILNDRLRMEDEWMSTQGPFSEFRMNLNTSNPLLLAAITTGGVSGGVSGMVDPMITATMGAGIGGARGLFFRSRTSNDPNNNDDDDTDDDDLFGQSLSTGTTPGVGFNGAGTFHPYMMGPLPPAGTDKDFVWGFILGFFVGFVMLFWVWMPTVPHRQKLGIISGISFQLAMNLLRKSTQTDGI